MDGTRAARTVALSTALVLGTALAVTTVLDAAPRDALHPGTASLTARGPLGAGTPVRPVSGHGAADTPHTTPPPTPPEQAGAPVRPAAASTVDHT